MTECKSCGRDSGHWIGCVGAAHSAESIVYNTTPLAPEDADQCVFPECANDKRPKGKGRAPMYCEDHSDPKNRK